MLACGGQIIDKTRDLSSTILVAVCINA